MSFLHFLVFWWNTRDWTVSVVYKCDNFSQSDWDCHHLIAMQRFIVVQTLHICYIKPIKEFLIFWLFFKLPTNYVNMGQFYFLCFLTWHIISISVNKIQPMNQWIYFEGYVFSFAAWDCSLFCHTSVVGNCFEVYIFFNLSVG